MNRDRSFAGLLAWAVCLAFLCACGARKEGAANSGGDALRIVTPFRIPSLDPARPASYFLVEFAIAELPLMLDAKGELRPHLLESYARIDERSWRLRVRANVRFQNGKPLTAAGMNGA